ncbi:hypothetical protein EDB85DRAFT_2004186 [Lactarius pseudohatsudake]|nr:hypothetical protein EDB85DRAFT_2004186 [Lactarius pseudohatsudake]
MLLVHDDDLARLAEVYVHGPLDAVLSLIRVLKPMVHNTRIDLSSARNSASADIESAWVATLSDIFETRSLSPTSSAFLSLHVRTPSLRGERSGIYTQRLHSAQQPEPDPPPQRHVSIQRAHGSSAVMRAFATATLRANAPDSAQLPYLFGNVTTPGLPFTQEAIPSSYESISSHASEKFNPLAQFSSRSDPPEQSGTTPISPINRTNAKVTGYPSYNHGAPRAQQGYLDPYRAGYATGPPGFLEPLSWLQSSSTSSSLLQCGPSGLLATEYPSVSSSVQRSRSGPSAGYSSASSSVQRSHSGQPTTLYAPSSSSIQHNLTGQSATRHPVASSVQHSPSGQSATHYSSASSSVRRNHSGQPATHYVPSISSDYSPLLSSAAQHSYAGQSTAYHPPTFDAANASYPEPQPTSHHHIVAHRYGTNASDDSRSSNRLYQTAAPLTRVTPDPPYRGTRPQESGVAQPQPGRGLVQGRQYNCRLPECNQPMFFDRHFNEFWEWCSPQHIHAGLGQRIEKTCRHCELWPRKYGHKYCGGPSCNKKGVPIPT